MSRKISKAFRTILYLQIFVLAFLLCACGSSGSSRSIGGSSSNSGSGSSKTESDAIYFTNNLDSVIHGVYISPSDSDVWGDRVVMGTVAPGKTVTIASGKLTNGEGVYDIGIIDENYMNYDAYGVNLYLGDTITISMEGADAVCTVDHSDGSTSIYYPDVYNSQEQENEGSSEEPAEPETKDADETETEEETSVQAEPASTSIDIEILYFTNNLDSVIHNVYISSPDSDVWGDPVTMGTIAPGKTITILPGKLENGEGIYDIGIIDENYMNYDIYGAGINFGDTISLGMDGEDVVCIIEHKDGYSSTYYPEVYQSE